MRDPLIQRIAVLRSCLFRQALVAGTCSTLAVVLGAALGIGAIDYLVCFEDPGVRILATLGIVLVLVWSIGRFLIPHWHHRPSDIALAQQAEQHNTRLEDQLSSAVAFAQLPENVLGAGSPVLRRAVIVAAVSAADTVDWRAVVPRRPLRRSLLFLGLLAVVLAILFVNQPKAAQTAVWRLIDPLGNHPWPRMHYLVVQHVPNRIAAGSSLEIEATDRHGRLPRAATMHYRIFHDGAWVEESVSMQRSQDRFVARKENVTQPIEFRVTGGDDTTMPWYPVDVVEPPRIRALTIMLYPPAYTGYLAYPSERHIRTLEGTEIALEGESTGRIRAARLVLAEEDRHQSAIPATVVDGGSRFLIERGTWKAAKTARYWFELEDPDGLIGKTDEPMSLRVFSDVPPAITFEVPVQDIYVTPNAKVPCTLLVKDDLAIREVVLLYMRDRDSETQNDPLSFQRIPLFQGPDRIPSKPEHADLTRDPGDRRRIEYVWDLASLKLSVGSELKLSAEASDYRPQVSRTAAPLKILIISHAELENRLGDQQSSILADLEQACALQRTAYAEGQSAVIQMNQVEKIRTSDRDALHAIELTQQQIARLLTDTKGGVLERIASLIAQMKNNQIDNPNALGQMVEIQDELEHLGRANLPIIARELTTAIKAAEATAIHEQADSMADDATRPALRSEITSALTTVNREQEQVLKTLERLLTDLREKAGYRQFARDFAEILAEQEQSIEQTRQQFATANPSARKEDLTRQQQADLQKAAGQQNALARRTAALGPPMVRAIEQLTEQESDAGEPLADGLAWIRDRHIASGMRDAAQNIALNRMGRALEHQLQVAEDLRELVDILRNRRTDGLSRRVKKLRAAERDLMALQERTIGLRQKMDSFTAGQNADRTNSETPAEKSRYLERLRQEQQALEQDMDRMARRLKRLAAQRASGTVGQAAARLRAGMAEPREGAENKPAPPEILQGVARDLRQAQEQLAEARRQAERDLADEQLVQLETVLRSLVEQQSYVLTETIRLQAAYDMAGRFTTEQADTVRSLADEEALLHEETMRSAQGIGGLGAIRHAMRNAAHAMHAGAQRLARQETDQATQRLEREALMQLQRLLTVLIADPDTETSAPENRAGGGSRTGGGPDENQRDYGLAELQLLRIMQQDLRDRTLTIEQNLSSGDQPSREELLAMQQIGEEQSALAQLMSDLKDRATALPSADAPDEGSADDLPDLDRELEMDLERSNDLNSLEPIESVNSQQRVSAGSFFLAGTGRLEGHFQGMGMAQQPGLAEDASQSDQNRVRGLGVKLGEGSADDSIRECVIRIHEQMEKAGRILREGDTSEKASQLQAGIIRDLDQWIELLKFDQSPPSADRDDQPPPPNSGKPADPDEATEKPGTPSQQAARDSVSPTSTSAESAVNMAQMHHLMDGIWGHLPSRTREQMIQSRPDTFLPEYELEIEQYYRRLAEDNERDR